MKKAPFIFLGTMLLLALGTGNTLAENSLTTILNTNFGPGNYHQIINENGFEFSPKPYEVTVILTDKQSGFNNPTGWYAVNNSSARFSIFDNPPSEVGHIETITPKENFGLYVNSGAGTFYSKASLNPDKINHVRVYQIDNGHDAGAYVLGFEDSDQATSSDWDYQDIVVELKGVSLAIPEFPTIALPVAAIVGFVFMFVRKKEKL